MQFEKASASHLSPAEAAGDVRMLDGSGHDGTFYDEVEVHGDDCSSSSSFERRGDDEEVKPAGGDVLLDGDDCSFPFASSSSEDGDD